MQYNLKKFLIASLVLILALSPVIFQQNVVAQAAPSVFVNPAENFFYTDTTSVGTEFDVTIEAADWPDPGVYSFELKLYYDSSMLEPVVAKIGIDAEFWITAFIAAGGLDTGDVPFVDPDTGETFLWFSATLLGVGGNVGGGILAKAGFQIIAEPPTAQPLLSDLDLRDVIMVDPSTTPPSAYPEDSYEVQDGIYQYSGPPPPHYLKVEPEIVAASEVGEEVSVTVMIYDVEADQKIIGAEFKLFFDPSILSLTDVTEGDFFKAFGPTFSVNYTETNYGVVAILLLPTDEGEYPPDDDLGFPNGDGSLANIKFEVTNLPEVTTEFPLELGDVVIIDEDLNELPPRRIEDAVLLAPTKREDLNQDGVINVLDMATFALAFGSYPDHPRWNARADIDRNGKVNILDGVLITVAFRE
jgi:hypothetical protein